MSRVLKFLSSLRLTVVLLGFGILLVFLGTLAQVHEGTWNAQKLYFQSWVIVKPFIYHRHWLVILPGGYLIGVVLLTNLILAHFRGANWGQRNVGQVLAHHVPLLALVFLSTWVAVRSPFLGMGLFIALLAADMWISRAGPLKNTYTGKKLGINFTHLGVVMLLLGQLATDQLAEESHLSFREGETRSWSEVSRKNELVFLTNAGTNHDEVVSIPESRVAEKKEIRHDKLPFVVRIKEYSANGVVRERRPMDTNPPPVTRGIGTNGVVQPQPIVTDNDSVNTPYAIVELERDGKSLGTWLAASRFLNEQEIEIDGKTWRMIFRPLRLYTPFTMQLLKTTHEVYPGTTKPRNFQSRVRIENPKTGENRETDIYMNNPLRYAGLTFYQYQMGRDEIDAGRRNSTLQVVRNPSWLTPYFGCGAVGYGLARHFLFYLIAFILKRRSA
jgi:hypothetical protein